jgi:DTW domain-containing protein YfiP
MKRVVCGKCKRPEKACICQFMCEIKNDVLVVVLQHKSESKQAKGTVPLILGSLSHCELFVGEQFAEDIRLLNILEQHQGSTALLYPGEKSKAICQLQGQKITCIIVLDGTWKKAYRLFAINEFLHSLPQVTLSKSYQGLYDIRKTDKENALSTLEATCYALTELEKVEDKYERLISRFIDFNRFLMSFNMERK